MTVAKSEPRVPAITGVSCRGVRKEYGGRMALDLAELRLARGEILAVVGPSGAGKSTLLRLIALLERPSAGELWFETAPGAERADHPPRSADPWAAGNGGEAGRVVLRRSMGFVTQRTVMFSGTVVDNVAYGLELRGAPAPEIDEAIGTALAKVGLEKAAGWPARGLSGGEAQRVALARALIVQPSLILLDEATANLDPANVGIIEGIIKAERERGATVIMVTHNLGQARRLADRVLFLWEGRAEYDGPAATFFAEPDAGRARAFVAGELVY